MSSLIDCDIHIEPRLHQDLEPYLTDYWRDYVNESAFVGPDANDYPAGAPLSRRPQTADTAQTGALSDVAADSLAPIPKLAHIQKDVLDATDVNIGILTCAYWVQSVHHPDLAAALATAINQWQIEHWLEKEPRLRASLVVPSQLPELAAHEIERFGNHPGFVQVLLPVRSDRPYGNRIYAPLYEAAVRHNLVVGIHYGGAPGHPPTPSGWPSTFTEEYAGMAQLFQSQVMSLIVEGTFDHFPSLKIALIESGFTWMPSLMWRMDKEWKGLRHNIPWVKRPPSAYMREHLRLTTAPLDAPPEPEQLMQIMAQMESDEMLMYASDYPHWHADEPMAIFGEGMPQELRKNIGSGNAREFYGL